jgi:hypothetical protein
MAEADLSNLSQEARLRVLRLRRVGGGLLIAAAVIVSIGFGTRAARTARVRECTGADSIDLNCFKERAAALTRLAGVNAALDDLSNGGKTNHYLFAACHQLTHVVGRTAGELRGTAAFTEGWDVCASGFYHGVTEAVMKTIGVDQILDRAQTVCAEQRERGPHSYLHYNCVHGMGHGFMGLYESDVFKALPGCDTLSDSWERHHCYGGVFMENLTAAGNPDRPSKHLRRDEPLYPCTAVDKMYRSECYAEQTAYALYVRNDDFALVFNLCRENAGPEFRVACYEGLGGDAAIKASKYVIGATAQATTIRNLCLQAPDDEARLHCVVGAVSTIVSDTSGEDEQARSLCAVLEESKLAAVCETARTSTVREFAAPRGAHQH